MTITPEQMAAVLAAAKEGRLRDRLHIDVWCDGSTACAVETEPHGHWRGGYSVDGTEVVLRLLRERDDARVEVDRLRAENEALRRADAEDGEALGKHIDDLNFRLLKETLRADTAVARADELTRDLNEVTDALSAAHTREAVEKKQLDALRWQVEHEGCAASHLGETTYECRADAPCGLCRLRSERDRLRAGLAT